MKNFRERLARWILGYDFLSKKKSNRDLLDLLKRNDGRKIRYHSSLVLTGLNYEDSLFVLTGDGNCLNKMYMTNSEILLINSYTNIIKGCTMENTSKGITQIDGGSTVISYNKVSKL